MSTPCIFCVAEFPHEVTDNCSSEPITTDEVIRIAGKVGAPPKNAEDMNNIEAAGRKRSVAAKPIKPGMVCEWAYLRQAGGGIAPIAGCPGNPATNVHHGPDKSVLNNDPDNNLSRICSHCHNRWHVANDKYYLMPRPANGAEWLPDPELVGDLEYFDLEFNGEKMTKVEALMLEAERSQDDARGRIK